MEETVGGVDLVGEVCLVEKKLDVRLGTGVLQRDRRRETKKCLQKDAHVQAKLSSPRPCRIIRVAGALVPRHVRENSHSTSVRCG